MNYFLQIYLSGLIVVGVAVVINLIAKTIGLVTWYSFLSNISKGLSAAIGKNLFINSLFLFIIYPLLIGFAMIYSYRILGMIGG